MSTVSMSELLEAAQQLADGKADCYDPTPNAEHPDDGVLIEFVYEGATFSALVTKT